MDLKVYTKEEVQQPTGTEYIYVPDIIDIYPLIEEDSEGNKVLKDAEIQLNFEDVLTQACSLVTIWQRGQDPLDLTDGIRWSQLFLDEVNIIVVMQDIIDAVSRVSDIVTVEFDTVTDAEGNERFTYKIKGVK